MSSPKNILIAGIIIAMVLVGVGIAVMYVQMITPKVNFPSQANSNILMGMPQWKQNFLAAQAKEEDDEDEAVALYKQALKEAWNEKADPAIGSAPPLQILDCYVTYLLRCGRFEEAEEVSKTGIARAKEYKFVDYESYFLGQQAAAQHGLFVNREIEKPDIALIEQAIKLLPPDGPNALPFKTKLDVTYADIAMDLGDLKTASQKIEEAIALTAKQGNQSHPMIMDTKIRILIEQGKAKEANDVFLQSMKDFPQASWWIVDRYHKHLTDKELREIGIRPTVRKLLREKKFDELDQLAVKYRSPENQLASGRWLIDAYHRELDPLDKSEPDERWTAYIKTFEEWIAAKPESETAKIAMGNVLTTYAWKARGGGYADTVSSAGWDGFEKRLDRAWKVLEQVKNKPPDWYPAAQKIALGQSWDDSKYDEMVNECRQKFPEYDAVIWTKMWKLQPRWGGGDGEAESYVEKEAAKRSPVDGDILYARVTWSLDKTMSGDVFEETGMKWDRAKKGMEELKKRFPKSISAPGELSILALQKNDSATASSAFAK